MIFVCYSFSVKLIVSLSKKLLKTNIQQFLVIENENRKLQNGLVRSLLYYKSAWQKLTGNSVYINEII